MEEWTEGVKIALDVIIAAIITTMIVTTMTLAHNVMQIADNQRAAAATVQEYRTARMYDGQDVYASDIVSLVIEHQGFPAITVHTRSGSTLTWSRASMSTTITSTAISAKLNPAKFYRCEVRYDANGSISEYSFTEEA